MIDVLVADDDEMCRITFEAMLTRLPGIVVTSAATSVEAWKALNERLFKLLILDVRMPGIDGLSLLERIRSNSRCPDLPVILCSGDLDRQTVLTAARLRVTLFIAKPFDVEATLAKIDRVLPKRGRLTVIV